MTDLAVKYSEKVSQFHPGFVASPCRNWATTTNVAMLVTQRQGCQLRATVSSLAGIRVPSWATILTPAEITAKRGKTVEEIFGNKLDSSALFKIYTLASTVLINDGKGHFTASIHALPELMFSKGCVRAADINGDGYADIFVGGRVVPGEYEEPLEG